MTAGIDGFAFQDSINAAYGFAWNEFCDWYLESIKERLRAGDAAAQDVAYFCLDNLMRLLHPFMPFVTEELWSRLPGDRGYVMRAEWPDLLDRFVDPGAEEEFQQVTAIVEEIRGHRQAAGAPSRSRRRPVRRRPCPRSRRWWLVDFRLAARPTMRRRLRREHRACPARTPHRGRGTRRPSVPRACRSAATPALVHRVVAPADRPVNALG